MYRRYFSTSLMAAALAACGTEQQETVNVDTPMDTLSAISGIDTSAPPPSARAVFRNGQGQEVGTASLTQSVGSVSIYVQLSMLEPGERGFHFHEVGACDAPDFESAGDHFDPTGDAHGFDHPEGPHAGDIRNLEVGSDGYVTTTLTNDRVTLHPGEPNSVFDGDGTALVVHAGRDDYRTQPAGDSGDRVACGVIEPA